MRAGGLRDMSAGAFAAGECDAADPRIRDDGVELILFDQRHLAGGARGVTIGRRTRTPHGRRRLVDAALQQERASRNGVCGLDDDAVARKQCGDGKSQRLPMRKIPRHDREDGSHRVVPNDHRRVGIRWHVFRRECTRARMNEFAIRHLADATELLTVAVLRRTLPDVSAEFKLHLSAARSALAGDHGQDLLLAWLQAAGVTLAGGVTAQLELPVF